MAAAVGLFATGINAQTGTLTDLGTLLAGQKNLTTFYTLIQVCRGQLRSLLRGESVAG